MLIKLIKPDAARIIKSSVPTLFKGFLEDFIILAAEEDIHLITIIDRI